MARIQIEVPKHFVFKTELSVYVGHLNYGNHLDNALLLSLVSEARLRFFKSIGYTELDIEGVGIVVSDVAVQYISEAFHADTLVVSMTPNDFLPKGCDLVWTLHEKTSGREVARGKTGIVFFDYTHKKPVHVPASFVEKVNRLPLA